MQIHRCKLKFHDFCVISRVVVHFDALFDEKHRFNDASTNLFPQPYVLVQLESSYDIQLILSYIVLIGPSYVMYQRKHTCFFFLYICVFFFWHDMHCFANPYCIIRKVLELAKQVDKSINKLTLMQALQTTRPNSIKFRQI